jgi:xanthine dehydrogenase accessory factor
VLSVYKQLAQDIRDKVAVVVATVIDGPDWLGHKMLAYIDGTTVGSIDGEELTSRVTADAVEALKYERAETHSYPLVDTQSGDVQEVRVFFEPNIPAPTLIIVGAGHTSIPLAAIAKIAGFSVTLIDARATFASNEGFKDVDEIIVEWPHIALGSLRVSPSTYVAVLTHDPKFEEPLLPILLRSDARYIGVIGSRRTQMQRRERLREEGFGEDDIKRLNGPIGLDIGAVTPEEIAVSILAEIVARRHGRPGGFLAEKLSTTQK